MKYLIDDEEVTKEEFEEELKAEILGDEDYRFQEAMETTYPGLYDDSISIDGDSYTVLELLKILKPKKYQKLKQEYLEDEFDALMDLLEDGDYYTGRYSEYTIEM